MRPSAINSLGEHDVCLRYLRIRIETVAHAMTGQRLNQHADVVRQHVNEPLTQCDRANCEATTETGPIFSLRVQFTVIMLFAQLEHREWSLEDWQLAKKWKSFTAELFPDDRHSFWCRTEIHSFDTLQKQVRLTE